MAGEDGHAICADQFMVAVNYVGTALDERATECMRHYDHANLARMYVAMIRDFCEMQTAMCRIMEESTDPAAAKIARDAFMCNPPSDEMKAEPK